MNPLRNVVIVGAGISGLSAAFFLRRAGIEVTVLERADAPGGTMQTVADGPWLVETGPTSALETTPLFAAMFDELGIAAQRLYADPSSDRRYIVRGGILHPLPMSLLSFLRTSLWSTGGKLRLVKEPFVGRSTEEETIAQFVERRLGREFLDYAINPFVAGVYAGDPDQLSVRAAFPKLYALEEKYGGLVRGMIGGARARRRRTETAKDRAKMFSFRAGMQTFPRAIARELDGHVCLNCEVTAVEPGSGDEPFRVLYRREGKPAELACSVVILAVPAFAAERIVRTISEEVADALRNIYYPPVAEVFLGFPRAAFTRPLDGFGYLVPAREGLRTLGTIWSSAQFPGRAPEGHEALTTFVGGSRQPDLAGLDDAPLIGVVTSELRSIMGVKGEPVYARVTRWERAIPQYNIGHLSLIAEVERFEKQVPGLHLCGNFRGGIAVGDCVMNGERLARRIALGPVQTTAYSPT